MVILLGGSSHVGKTLFAQKLMEELHYPYVSLDHLKMAFIRTGRTHLTVEDDAPMRYFLWPFAAEMIKTAIENGQNLIVEGCYIPENWRDCFEKPYLDRIRCVFLVMSEAYLRAHFDAVQAYANVIEHRIADRPDLERLIACSKGFFRDCIEYGIPCVEIDGAYDPDAILQKIREKLGLENGER